MGGKEGRGDAGWAGAAGSRAVKTVCVQKEKTLGWADVASFGGGLRIPHWHRVLILCKLIQIWLPETSGLFRPHKTSAHCGAAALWLSFQVAVAPGRRLSQSIGASQTGRQTQRASGGTV